MKFIDKLRDLLHDPTIDRPCGVGLRELIVTLGQLMYEIELADSGEEDRYIDWVYECRKLGCEIVGAHGWQYDHCGYYGHQYCDACGASKYPELRKLSCSEASEKYGNITEDQYLEQRKEQLKHLKQESCTTNPLQKKE